MDVLTDGYALPVSGGLYPPPPYLYRGATAIIASYEADPAAIAGLPPRACRRWRTRRYAWPG